MKQTSPTNKLILLSGLFIVFVTAYSLIIPKLAVAQSATTGLSAIPPRLEITVKPSEVITKQIKVRNESATEKVVSTSINDFIVTDNSGTPVQVESNKEDNRWAASSWIQVSPTSLKLKPGETKSISVTIIAPENALPGGHYAMILHSPNNGNNLTQTGASVQTQVGTLVYITIPGNITQNAIVKDFTAPKFSEFGPIDFKSTIQNLSDIHIRPAGDIAISNMIGFKISHLQFNSTDINIFPYTSRDFTNILNKKFLFGRYKAELSAAYGTAGGVATAVIFFWVIPWRLIILLLAAGAIVTAIILINKNKPKDDVSEEKVEELEKELDDLKKKYKD